MIRTVLTFPFASLLCVCFVDVYWQLLFHMLRSMVAVRAMPIKNSKHPLVLHTAKVTHRECTVLVFLLYLARYVAPPRTHTKFLHSVLHSASSALPSRRLLQLLVCLGQQVALLFALW